MLRMRLIGANPTPQITGIDELPGKVNYFIGKDPSKWRSDVPTYTKVEYKDVYPGVNLVYYGNQRQLEYDFIVAPGVDPRAIKLDFEGTEMLEIDSHGNLVISIADSQEKIRMKKPIIYQEIEGARKETSGDYVLLPSSGEAALTSLSPLGEGQGEGKYLVGFQVAAYDTSRPLVIDPVLAYSTYLGGEASLLKRVVALPSILPAMPMSRA